MQLAKSGAVKKNLIQTGRLHLPQIDFCKSTVSNIPSQNALIESILWSISGTPSSLLLLPSEKVFITIPRSYIPLFFSRKASFGQDVSFICRRGDVQIIIYYHNSINKKNGFSNIRCTLWLTPSPALHQEIEEEGEEHQKRKEQKRQSADGRDSCSGERCARCAGGESALGPALNPVSRNNKHPQMAWW